MARATSWDSDTESDSDTVPFHLGDILTQAAGRRFRPAGAGCWLLVLVLVAGAGAGAGAGQVHQHQEPATSNQQPAASLRVPFPRSERQFCPMPTPSAAPIPGEPSGSTNPPGVIWRWAAVFATAVIILAFGAPEGITVASGRLFAIFAASIVG